jgi:hypothetical protein
MIEARPARCLHIKDLPQVAAQTFDSYTYRPAPVFALAIMGRNVHVQVFQNINVRLRGTFPSPVCVMDTDNSAGKIGGQCRYRALNNEVFLLKRAVSSVVEGWFTPRAGCLSLVSSHWLTHPPRGKRGVSCKLKQSQIARNFLGDG